MAGRQSALQPSRSGVYVVSLDHSYSSDACGASTISRGKACGVTIKNSCVESVLLSVRDLDDFFRPRTDKDRDSDLRASDFFGYQSPGPFLSDAERASINQWIAHLTYYPVWTSTTGIQPDTPRNWNTAELVGKAARAVFKFMDHLHHHLSQRNSDRVSDIQKVRTALELALKNMEALADLENEYFAKADSGITPKTSS